jgi:multiple sugar transport system substrate-binding protein
MYDMKRTKVGAVLVSMTLVASLLAACAGGTTGSGAAAGGGSQAPEPPKDKGAAAPAPAPAAPAPPKEAKITWWTAWNDDQGPLEIIQEFNKKFPNIKVEHVKFLNSDEGNVKIDVSLLAGQDIDVFFNYNISRLQPRAAKGLLADLSEFIQKDKFDVEAELGKGIFKQDNKYVSLPVSSVQDGVFINKKMLDAAGLSVPKDWSMEEFQDYAKKLSKGDGPGKIYGSADFHSNYYWTMPARSLLGSDFWFNKDGLSNFDNPAFKKSLEIKYQMEVTDKVQYPYTEYKATKLQAFDVFMQQKAALVVASNAMARFINDTKQYPRDFIASVAPLPTLDKDQKVNYNKGLHYFGYLGINAKSAQKEASWTFMKWLATEGSPYLAKVGHLPTWKKTNKDQVLKIMFGDDADKKVDVEAFKRVMLDYESQGYNDTNMKANGEIYKIHQDEAEKALFKTQSIDEAISAIKKKSDEAIKNAK